MLLYAAMSIVGITWGLPTSRFDDLLFGGGPAWSGEKIYRLVGGGAWTSPARGADVDADPLHGGAGGPIHLTATEAGAAAIYLRYRLYTYQPDEMIVMRSLGAMRPGRFDFDPKLYQYGGLFIYPVGAFIRVAGLLGLIDVRSDVVYYLDHPDEFGKFYIVSRAYAAAWGLVGVWVVFAIGRRLSNAWGGLLATLLFILMPVVVCMAHEGKPHLPGAVLMLAAVLFAMRHLEGATPKRDWRLMCICCGAAFGMVLSSLPIFVLIPLAALVEWGGGLGSRGRVHLDASYGGGSIKMHPTAAMTPWAAVRSAVGGITLASLVYLLVNPYLVINALTNREVLASNFGNSLAMYEISRIGEGFVRVVELTTEGATLPIVLLGSIAFVVTVVKRRPAPDDTDKQVCPLHPYPLLGVALVILVQFVLIGAGKPAEYGRFGVFVNTALAIGAACLLMEIGKEQRTPLALACLALAALTALSGAKYLQNFRSDAANDTARAVMGRRVNTMTASGAFSVAVPADPAPYGCPPMNFAEIDVIKVRAPDALLHEGVPGDVMLLAPVDRPVAGSSKMSDGIPLPPGFIRLDSGMREDPVTPISWANKPIEVIMRISALSDVQPPEDDS